ncbi:MAG: HD domain-containing phosphohydrolase [Gemmatimonadota bacterium]
MKDQSRPVGAASVVIVDDDVLALALLEEIVTGLPAVEVTTFTDPHNALAYCQVSSPDVIISDYQMPEMDGLTLLARLREEPALVTVPIMIVTAMTDREVRHRALELGASDFLSKPFDAAEIIARIRNMILLHRAQQVLEVRAQELAFQVRLATATLSDREQEVVMRLSRAAEFRDWESGAHITRMAHYSRIIAATLGQSKSEQDLLFLAAPMHDVGKIGIPDYILLKPSQLDDEEFGIMKQHTTIGHQILSESKSELLQLAATVALTHHERFDGKGYPRGIAGEDIPISSRILCLADVFDALVSERPYKTAWTSEAALRSMSNGRGTHFDPECYDAFTASIAAIQETRLSFPDVPLRMSTVAIAA